MSDESKPFHERSGYDFFTERVLPVAFWFLLHVLVVAYLFLEHTPISDDVKDSGKPSQSIPRPPGAQGLAGPHLLAFSYIFAIVASGFLFVRTSVMDPGVISTTEDEKQETEAVDPSARFCPVCNHWQKLRSKHCRLCQRCVAKYDHHCYWMGNCIGEKNHASFWWFLFVQDVVLVWSIVMMIQSIESTNWETAEEFCKKDMVAVLLIIMMLLCGWLPVALLGFHSYLILTNQTTWEFNVRARITYLRGYPNNFNPFSQGCCGNVELTCCDFNPNPIAWRPLMHSPPQKSSDQKSSDSIAQPKLI